MLTFRDIQLEILRYVDEAEDTDTTLAIVKDAINRSHRKILTARTWPFMNWPIEASFTTVAGQRVYALKQGMGKVTSLFDVGLSDFFPLISRREWETVGVDRIGQQPQPAGAIYGDEWPVAAQPVSEAVTATSSTDTDAANTVILIGLNTSGDMTTETLTLADIGSTAAATSSTLWKVLFGVTKGAAFTGTLTLTSATAGTLLSLTASEYAKQYPTIEFVETPAAAREYVYTVQRTPTVLTSDHQVPDIPFPHSEILVYDTLLDWSAYSSELGSKQISLWKARYDELWDNLIQYSDEAIAGSHPRFVRNMNPRLASRIHMNRNA